MCTIIPAAPGTKFVFVSINAEGGADIDVENEIIAWRIDDDGEVTPISNAGRRHNVVDGYYLFPDGTVEEPGCHIPWASFEEFKNEQRAARLVK